MHCERENDMIKKPLNNLPRLLTAMILTALPLGMPILLSSCGDVFDTHPYDVNVKGETDINAKQIAVIEKQFAMYYTKGLRTLFGTFFGLLADASTNMVYQQNPLIVYLTILALVMTGGYMVVTSERWK